MTEWEHLFKCPHGHFGRIDDEQLAGDASIVCTGNYDSCEFHGHVDEGEVVERNWRAV